MKRPAVYIMASGVRGTLYVGVTSDLIQRVWRHREGTMGGFTARHKVKGSVWYERHESMEMAIGREKLLKKWRREWRSELIESVNPQWQGLWEEMLGE